MNREIVPKHRNKNSESIQCNVSVSTGNSWFGYKTRYLRTSKDGHKILNMFHNSEHNVVILKDFAFAIMAGFSLNPEIRHSQISTLTPETVKLAFLFLLNRGPLSIFRKIPGKTM